MCSSHLVGRDVLELGSLGRGFLGCFGFRGKARFLGHFLFHGLLGEVDGLLADPGDGDDRLVGDILVDEEFGLGVVALAFDLLEEAFDSGDLGELGRELRFHCIELRLVDRHALQDGRFGNLVLHEIPHALISADLVGLGDHEVEALCIHDDAEVATPVEIEEIGPVIADPMGQRDGRLGGVHQVFQLKSIEAVV